MNVCKDWTQGQDAIVYQRCARCDHVQYLRRAFCSVCGNDAPEPLAASGLGTVFATSLVHRAATAEWRAEAPYNIVLVDTDEGFRLMAHGAHDLAIGDRVSARFKTIAGRLVPYFER